MTKESAWLKVVTAAHKITGIDITERTVKAAARQEYFQVVSSSAGGRGTKHVGYVRGIVYHILSKYYEVNRSETAALAGTDHGTISYHILQHDKRYVNYEYYRNNYNKVVEYLFGTKHREKYAMIDDLIKQI